MTDQRKLREVNGAACLAIPGADANGIGERKPGTCLLRYTPRPPCYPKREKLAADMGGRLVRILRSLQIVREQ
jgi:hypothetical protein